MMTSITDYVSIFRTQNINVFPLQPKSKIPAESWKIYQNQKYGGEIHEPYNYAVLGGSISDNLVIIDIDKLDDPTFLDKVLPNCINETLVTRSGSGGFHIFVKVLKLPNSVKLDHDGIHIDVQSEGKYVVGPGSIHPNGKPYEVISGTTTIKIINFQDVLVNLEKLGFSPSLTLGKDYIEIAKSNVQVGNRHSTGLSYANHLIKSVGVDFETLNIEMERWNSKLESQLPKYELNRIIKDAWEFQQKQKEKDQLKHRQEGRPPQTPFEAVNEIMVENIFRTIRDTEEILIYKNGVYHGNNQAETKINEICDQLIEDCNTYKCNEAINTIKRRTYVNRDDFDSNEIIINVKNGLINIETLEFKKHTPTYLSRIQLPIIYDPNARPQIFLKFLKQCLPDPKDFYTTLEAFASCLCKTTKFEKAFMFIGEGENGKSTFLKTMQEILGKENVTNISIHELVTNRFAKAELEGKLANIYADIEDDELKNTGILKMLISGDSLQVEKKNMPFYKMENFAKLFFSANRFPEVDDQSNAMFRRFIIIDWVVSFANRKDPYLYAKLTTEKELSGIFNLIIRIANKLNKRGKFLHEPKTEQLRVKWNELSQPIQKFIDERLVLNDKLWVEKASLYSDYIQFCVQNNIIRESPQKFNHVVETLTNAQNGQKFIEGTNVRIWKGLTLRSRLKDQKQEVIS